MTPLRGATPADLAAVRCVVGDGAGLVATDRAGGLWWSGPVWATAEQPAVLTPAAVPAPATAVAVGVPTWVVTDAGRVLRTDRFATSVDAAEWVEVGVGGAAAVSVSASVRAAAVVDADHRVWWWGHNRGQCGTLPVGEYDVFTVDPTLRARQVFVGDAVSHVLDVDGQVWRFAERGSTLSSPGGAPVPFVGFRVAHSTEVGWDDAGNVFISEFGGQWVPTSLGTPVVDVAVGGWHVVAVDDLGRLWGAGSNVSAQLGRNVADTTSVPWSLLGVDEVVSVAAGPYSTLVVRADGTLWASGEAGSTDPFGLGGAGCPDGFVEVPVGTVTAARAAELATSAMSVSDAVALAVAAAR